MVNRSFLTMLLFVLLVTLAVATTTSVETSDCKCPIKCRPTCTVPNPKNCGASSKCTYCDDGKVWSDIDEKCVSIYECPYNKGCNGDPNASIIERPPPCPSTCEAPNESPCKKMGLPLGCACNAGYIRSKEDGKCITVDSCPGGNPCGVNGTFAYCKIDCPSSFCPVDDSPGIVICDPGPTCPSGCVCKYKYTWKSEKDRTCILSQECPAVKCTRPNEVWDPCPSPCFSDGCENFNVKQVCNTLVEPSCYPQCRCKKGYARENVNFTCIRGNDCPKYQKTEVET